MNWKKIVDRDFDKHEKLLVRNDSNEYFFVYLSEDHEGREIFRDANTDEPCAYVDECTHYMYVIHPGTGENLRFSRYENGGWA